MDIVAFIRARLDEDEGIAQLISPGGYAPQEWRDVTPKNAAGWHEIRAFDRTNIEPPEAAQDEGGEPVAVVPGGRGEHEHIARHDPARVLREVEVKRALLERYATAVAPTEDDDVERVKDDRYSWGWQDWYAEALKPAAHQLAAVWSDHPDYREEWRPTRG